MAEVAWSKGRNALGIGNVPDVMAATFGAALDTTEWTAVSGEINVLIAGGTTYTIEIHRSTIATTYSDAILVDTQDETERAAAYRFKGGGWIRFRLAALTGTAPTVRVTR